MLFNNSLLSSILLNEESKLRFQSCQTAVVTDDVVLCFGDTIGRVVPYIRIIPEEGVCPFAFLKTSVISSDVIEHFLIFRLMIFGSLIDVINLFTDYVNPFIGIGNSLINYSGAISP